MKHPMEDAYVDIQVLGDFVEDRKVGYPPKVSLIVFILMVDHLVQKVHPLSGQCVGIGEGFESSLTFTFGQKVSGRFGKRSSESVGQRHDEDLEPFLSRFGSSLVASQSPGKFGERPSGYIIPS